MEDAQGSGDETSSSQQQQQQQTAEEAAARQQQQKEAAELHKAAVAAETAAAAGLASCAADVLQLAQHRDLVLLLRQVQHSLLLLLASGSPSVQVPTVAVGKAAAAAGSKHHGPFVTGRGRGSTHEATAAAATAGAGGEADAAVDAVHPGDAAAAATNAAAAVPPAVRTSKRARQTTVAAAEAAQQGHRVGSAAAAAAGGGGSSSRVPAAASGARSGGRTRRGFSLQSSRDKHLMVDAAIGVLAAQDLDPGFKGDVSRVYGLVEGLCCLLSLRLADAADAQVARFLLAAWDRLVVLMQQALTGYRSTAAGSSSSSSSPALAALGGISRQLQGNLPQMPESSTQLEQQHQLLCAVDGGLGQLLLDLFGLTVPWRDAMFGRAPLVKLLASKAAAAAVAAVPSSPQSVPAAAQGAVDSKLVLTIAQAAVKAGLTAAPAAAAVVAANVASSAAAASSKHLQLIDANTRYYSQASTATPAAPDTPWSVLKQGLFKARPLSAGLELPDLLRAWHYAIVDTPGRQLGAAAGAARGAAALGKHSMWRRLMQLAAAAAAPALEQQKRAGFALAGLAVSGRGDLPPEARSGAAQVSGEPAPPDLAAGGAAGESLDDPSLQLLLGQTGAGGDTECSDSDSSSSSGSDEDASHEQHQDHEASSSSATELAQRRYWRKLKPLLALLQEKLPQPPSGLVAGAAARVAAMLGEPAMQTAPAPAAQADAGPVHAASCPRLLLPPAAAAAAAAEENRATPQPTPSPAPSQQRQGYGSWQGGRHDGSLASDGDSIMEDADLPSPAAAADAGAAATPASRSPSCSNIAAAGVVGPVNADLEAGPKPAGGPQASTAASTATTCGWNEADMQMVLEGRAFDDWYVSGPSRAQQAAANPLWRLHAQLSAALLVAEAPRVRDKVSLKPEGLHELELLEQRVGALPLSCRRVSFCTGHLLHGWALLLLAEYG